MRNVARENRRQQHSYLFLRAFIGEGNWPTKGSNSLLEAKASKPINKLATKPPLKISAVNVWFLSDDIGQQQSTMIPPGHSLPCIMLFLSQCQRQEGLYLRGIVRVIDIIGAVEIAENFRKQILHRCRSTAGLVACHSKILVNLLQRKVADT